MGAATEPTVQRSVWDMVEQVFGAYAESVEAGNLDTLLAQVADDVTTMVTLPEAGRGVRVGRDAIADLVRWRWEAQQLRGRISLDGITVNDHMIGCEYRIAGTLRGLPYRNHAAIFFDLEGDRVNAMREYFGDNTLAPAFFEPFGLERIFRERTPGEAEAAAGKPPTLSTIIPTPVHAQTLDVARRAFGAFVLSVEHGNWQPFLELMAEDVTFTLPIPGRWRGKKQGKAEVAAYHRWRWEDLRMRTPVMLNSMTANGGTVAFEFRIDGVIGDNIRVKHPAVYYLDVQADKVVGFREYNGDEEPIPDAR